MFRESTQRTLSALVGHLVQLGLPRGLWRMMSLYSSQTAHVFTATVAAMYYSYYMLPDGTYCLAPPPPGVDVATYYSTLPARVAVSSSSGVTTTALPPPGTTPPPPPTTAETSSGVTATTITTR